jgi:CRP-like cAMP-binding protein
MSTMPSRGELKRNLKLLKERLEERPMDLDARMRIARTYRLMGESSESVAHYGAVARYLSLAGHPLQAVAVLKELLQVDPRHDETLLFLAKLYARTRAADNGNRGRVAVPIVDVNASADPTVVPLAEGLPTSATGIWRAIRPAEVPVVDQIVDVEDIGAVIDEHDEQVEEVADHNVDLLDTSLEASILSRVPLFASLDPAAWSTLRAAMVLLRAEPGEVLFAEGEAAESCLVIARGEALVTRRLDNGSTVERSRLHTGDIAGMFALVQADVRQATLTAVDNVEYFEIDRAAITALIAAHPQARTVLTAFIRDRLVDTMFLDMPLCASLPVAARLELRERLVDKTFDADDDIVSMWAETDGLWIVLDGALIVGEEPEDGGTLLVEARLGPGDWVLCAAGTLADVAGVAVQASTRTTVMSLPHVAVAPLLASRDDALDEFGPAQVLTDAVRVGTLRRQA